MLTTKIRASQISASTPTDGITDLHIKANAAIDPSKIDGLPELLTDLQTTLLLESTSRISSDITLQASIESEATVRTLATSSATEALNTEITARSEAVALVRSDLNAEISLRQTAHDLEVTARIEADFAEITARTLAIADETSARISAISAETNARQTAVAELEASIVEIGTSTEWQASCTSYGIVPPVNPSVGDRVLIVETINTTTGVVTTGIASGAFATREDKIATCVSVDPSVWAYTTVRSGSFTSVDTVSKGVLCFVSNWSLKQFEATIAGDGLTSMGLTLNTNLHTGGGLVFDEISNGLKIDTSKVVVLTNLVFRAAFTGALDGANNIFGFPTVHVTGSELIFINGVLQNPNNDYNVVGQSIVFTFIPEAADIFVLNYLSV